MGKRKRRDRLPSKRKRMPKAQQGVVPQVIQDYLKGAWVVVGMDEVGWGSIAGPLVVTACTLRGDYSGPRLRDSKKYTTEKKRKQMREVVEEHCLDWVEVSVPAEVVAENPQYALEEAQRQVIWHLLEDKEWDRLKILVDGKRFIKGLELEHRWCVGGDDLIPAISAASILAKTSRDAYMIGLSETYPHKFCRHKGYGTAQHLEELGRYGVTPEHRLNISSVQEALEKVGKYEAFG